jgi:hypothetical protein
MRLKYQIGLKLKLFIVSVLMLLPLGGVVFAQFVEDSRVSAPVNTPAIDSGLKADAIFDVLIILSALMFIISMFGFGIGFLKMVTSGGDEKTAEAGSNMLVLSGWIFGASALSFLVVNVVKYFIY